MAHFFNINYPTYKGKNMTVRIEHDLLGDREIPAEVYWGIHTLRAIENFKISTQKISDVPQFVRSMGDGRKKQPRRQTANWVQ